MNLAQLISPHFESQPGWDQLTIAGISSDSREIEPGFLFAALPGTQIDGARFIPQALERGAVAIIADIDADLPDGLTVPVFLDDNPRALLALMARQFYTPQPKTIVGVTGTNGKTSVASFVRQIWTTLGVPAASLGTVGIVSPRGEIKLAHTTPEPVLLHQSLQQLTYEGVEHLAIEASSHGLAQRRLEGVEFAAAAFTNISRDHLDYHETFEAYFAEKKRLFSELLPDGAIAVVNADAEGAEDIIQIVDQRMLNLVTVGNMGRYLRLRGTKRQGQGQVLSLAHEYGRSEIKLPLVGEFQASNALVACALVAVSGHPIMDCIEALETMTGAKGRLEHVGQTKNGASIFIDYAHTPDALANALLALRPYADGRLVVVFGCGGDRDKGKRPQMGEIAQDYADMAIITDDNPRSEDPAQIRAEILSGHAEARDIADRAKAIGQAIEELAPNDLLLIAGKGHETGQIIGDKVLPFSDHEVVGVCLAGSGDA